MSGLTFRFVFPILTWKRTYTACFISAFPSYTVRLSLQKRNFLMDRFLSSRGVNINPVVATPYHLANRYGKAFLTFYFDHAFRIFVSCQLAAAIRTIPREWIPDILILIHL